MFINEKGCDLSKVQPIVLIKKLRRLSDDARPIKPHGFCCDCILSILLGFVNIYFVNIETLDFSSLIKNKKVAVSVLKYS